MVLAILFLESPSSCLSAFLVSLRVHVLWNGGDVEVRPKVRRKRDPLGYICMPVSGPGQGSPWSASRPTESVPLQSFFRKGVSCLPVALVPTDGGAIRLSESELFQQDLRKITGRYLDIEEVRRFGKTGILCRSSNVECLTDLLACTSWGDALTSTSTLGGRRGSSCPRKNCGCLPTLARSEEVITTRKVPPSTGGSGPESKPGHLGRDLEQSRPEPWKAAYLRVHHGQLERPGLA
ncbi:hypothetical protein HPB50_011369 [Hyalomma asiaticum]|uniref:Uncharacterized protein n=1 Tax=Hyalomma asiaticum TaxID=266040 RepID=A0ACB7RRR2_HYAAI|nr:hypothetical protein HPB50_011369 [Hyalomma asiaticum]